MHPSATLVVQAQLSSQRRRQDTHCSLPSPGLCSCPAPAHSGLGGPVALHQAAEEEGSAWHDVLAGCVRAGSGHRLCLGQRVGACLCGCILLVWAVCVP